MGASHESLLAKAESFTAVIEDISGRTQSRLILLALLMGLVVVLVSFLVARMMARAMHQLK